MTARAGETLVLFLLAAAASVLTRASLPLGLASSQARVGAASEELRLLLFAGLALLVLLRARGWGTMLTCTGTTQAVLIVVVSAVYLHAIGCVVASVPGLALFRNSVEVGWSTIAQSLWLSSLAGLLALARAAPRNLGLCFLLVAWWVPVLGFPDPGSVEAVTKGISRTAWTADGILPMLVPHLLAVGYVCLERAQR